VGERERGSTHISRRETRRWLLTLAHQTRKTTLLNSFQSAYIINAKPKQKTWCKGKLEVMLLVVTAEVVTGEGGGEGGAKGTMRESLKSFVQC